MKVKATLYKLVIEPTLLHGCVAYGMTRDDWLALEKTQNLIQRTFVKCNLADVHDRWVYIHSKLKTLRSRGDLSDSVLTLKKAFVKATFSKATERILEYRNHEWQASTFPGKPRRRKGRPPNTLLMTIRDVTHELSDSRED